MTTSTTPEPVPVEGTPFVLTPLPVLWDEGGVVEMVGDEVSVDYDHNLGRTTMDFYFGPEDGPEPDDLPARDAEPAVIWGLKAPGDERLSPFLWRRADGAYVARQLDRVFSQVWSTGDQATLPDRVAGWLRLVVPLLNRGVPQALLVGCKEYVEATRDQEGR
jgi:hypothetical protein